MTIATTLAGWTIPDLNTETRIRRYSITGDILSYKRCRRQYGYFGIRGFSSATATQRYFGTLVHDVLDRIHRDYKVTPALPNQAEVELLVEQAHDRLIRSGIRPYNSKQQRARAATLIFRFVTLVGPHFFPHVMQTEYRLERAMQTPKGKDYILNGVVDVLSGAVSHALGLPFSTEEDDIEIWDYKSGSMPAKSSDEMKSYQYQMQVYAELYRQQTGEYPARSVLAFVGELGDDKQWAKAEKDLNPARYPMLVYAVHPVPKHVGSAVKDFHNTVEEIEAERLKSYQLQWQPPTHAVDQQTCEACELRFNCSSYPAGTKLRGEPL